MSSSSRISRLRESIHNLPETTISQQTRAPASQEQLLELRRRKEETHREGGRSNNQGYYTNSASRQGNIGSQSAQVQRQSGGSHFPQYGTSPHHPSSQGNANHRPAYNASWITRSSSQGYTDHQPAPHTSSATYSSSQGYTDNQPPQYSATRHSSQEHINQGAHYYTSSTTRSPSQPGYTTNQSARQFGDNTQSAKFETHAQPSEDSEE